jgi:maltose O-acetyltransferase
MATEKEKMLSGALYNGADKELVLERLRTRQLLKQFNDSLPDSLEFREQLLRELIPLQGKGLYIEPPFFCDYGSNITVGEKVYLNFNCTILDVTTVNIGNNVLIGPSVQMYAATHPVDWKVRSSGLENGKPISIGDDVWIGGGSIICPGVNIGARTIIGAGSVVTKNIPADVVAAGNPCRIIRKMNGEL